MQLKPQDLKTFESYKKAMRMAASQIKDNTKFCIYTDVQLPDAGGKMHVLKPFLALCPPAMLKPLLTPLKGGKRLISEGTCSLHEGKVILKGNKVPFGQLKTQATFFKDLLGGKAVAAPAGVKEEDEEEEAVEAKAATPEKPAPPPPPAATGIPKPPAQNIAASTGNQPPPPAPPKPGPQAGTTTAPPAAPAAQEPHPVRLAKASVAWHGTRGIVDGQCKQLKEAIRAHYGNSHPEVLKAIEGNMHKIDVIVERLDHKLADSLTKASAAPAAARTAELRVAQGILNEYIRYVNAEPSIDHIDRNPFGVKCNLRQVLASSLKQMSQSLIA